MIEDENASKYSSDYIITTLHRSSNCNHMYLRQETQKFS